MQMSKGRMKDGAHPARHVTPAQAGVQSGPARREAAAGRWIPGQARNDVGGTEDRLFSGNGHHISWEWIAVEGPAPTVNVPLGED